MFVKSNPLNLVVYGVIRSLNLAVWSQSKVVRLKFESIGVLIKASKMTPIGTLYLRAFRCFAKL